MTPRLMHTPPFTELHQVVQEFGSDPVLASYIGPANGFLPKLTHAVITAVTSSPYSHSEIVLPSLRHEEEDIGYTSSERDGGVRAKAIDFNDGKWHLIPLPWLPRYRVLRHYAETKHHGYDFWGLRMFLGMKDEDAIKKDWCSEWCGQCLQLKNPRVSPGVLHKQCTELFMQWQMEHFYGK